MLPSEYFAKELALIQNQPLRELTKYCLDQAPEYFMTTQASITGKYHHGETIPEHTRIAFYIGNNLARYDNDINIDVVRCAILLHDIAKYGLLAKPETLETDPNREWFKAHARVGALYCKRLIYSRENINIAPTAVATAKLWDRVCDAIEGHNGQWEQKPSNKEGWVVHFADMASSTRELIIALNTEENKDE